MKMNLTLQLEKNERIGFQVFEVKPESKIPNNSQINPQFLFRHQDPCKLSIQVFDMLTNDPFQHTSKNQYQFQRAKE